MSAGQSHRNGVRAAGKVAYVRHRKALRTHRNGTRKRSYLGGGAMAISAQKAFTNDTWAVSP